MPIEFETERLYLRQMNETDADAVFAMRSDENVMRFIRAPQIFRSEAEDWINLVSSRWESDKTGFCAVIEKASDKFIGWCGLWHLKETGEMEVGYALFKEFWGRGFASEAAEVFLKYGFNELNLEKIVAVAEPENQASQNVMKRLGMIYDYTDEFYGRDLVHYSITKNDYFRNRKTSASPDNGG
jgi:ribosomal-protein-alanine N-acetyltransferase